MTSVRSRLWVLTLLVISSILLASCGGSSNSSSNHSNNDRAVDREPEPDPAIPEPEAIIVSKSLKPGIRDGIEVVFNEPMNPSSLELEGMLAEIAARPEWSDDNQKVTLRPAEGAWESGRHIILGSLQSAAGAPVSLTLEVEIRLVFETFQEASFVIGQPDFESSTFYRDTGPNTLREPFGAPSIVEGVLWLPDWGNNRLLGFDGIPKRRIPTQLGLPGKSFSRLQHLGPARPCLADLRWACRMTDTSTC